MIESTFIGICAAIFGCWIAIVVVTMTIADLQLAMREKVLRRHPHARKWRSRPFISVVYDSLPSESSEQSLRRGSYRHIDFSNTNNDRFLSIGGRDILARTALNDANTRFQHRPSTRFVEIIPELPTPQTITELFHTYHLIAAAPFVKVRAVLAMRSRQRLWPTVSSKEQQHTWHDRVYDFFKWLLSISNILVFLYVTNIMITTGESIYLLCYTALFCVWLILSVIDYPQLRPLQKIIYILLIPTSLGYFLVRVLAAPFMPLRLVPLHVARHRVLS